MQKALNVYSSFSIKSDNSIFYNENKLSFFLRKQKVHYLLLKKFRPISKNFIIIGNYKDYNLYKYNYSSGN